MASDLSKNRAKTSSTKDWLGLIAVTLSILALMYLLMENYMGYTGLKSLFQKDKPVKHERSIQK